MLQEVSLTPLTVLVVVFVEELVFFFGLAVGFGLGVGVFVGTGVMTVAERSEFLRYPFVPSLSFTSEYVLF